MWRRKALFSTGTQKVPSTFNCTAPMLYDHCLLRGWTRSLSDGRYRALHAVLRQKNVIVLCFEEECTKQKLIISYSSVLQASEWLVPKVRLKEMNSGCTVKSLVLMLSWHQLCQQAQIRWIFFTLKHKPRVFCCVSLANFALSQHDILRRSKDHPVLRSHACEGTVLVWL